MNVIANQKAALQRGQEASANRFFWIAGLTVLNTGLTLYSNTIYGSATALGAAQIVNAFAASVHIQAIGIIFTLICAAMFAAFGWFARGGNVIVFYVGMGIYAVDALLLVLYKEYIGIGIHALILYRLYVGVQHATQLQALIRQEEADLARQRVGNARVV